jgi:hypothetical protein
VKAAAYAGQLFAMEGCSVTAIWGCPLGIKLVGVSDGSCLTHHLVCVGSGAIGVELAAQSSAVFLRRAAPLAMENKMHTKSRLNTAMITILCLRSSWKKSLGLRRNSERSFNMFSNDVLALDVAALT